MSQDRRTVIVEDNFIISTLWEEILTGAGIPVIGTAASPDEAIELILRERPRYVLMDVRLNDEKDGVDVANAVYAEDPSIRIIYITASAEPPNVDRINSDHPFEILFKPVNENVLLDVYEQGAA